MSRLSIRPTGRERPFHDDEILVSKTDLTGKITYVNDIFARVSCYARGELIGAPHSIIRHPAMPRGIYQLLWEQIQAGREIFAYIVNLCKNGDHYWVFAHVTPSFGAQGEIVGYHSNRRTAPRAALQEIERLYAEMQRIEAAHEKKRDAAAAGLTHLNDVLATRGVSYDEFVWSL